MIENDLIKELRIWAKEKFAKAVRERDELVSDPDSYYERVSDLESYYKLEGEIHTYGRLMQKLDEIER